MGNSIKNVSTGNRFTGTDASQIASALSSNKRLEVLRLGNNPLGASGALDLINAMIPAKSPNLNLKFLDLENVWAEKEILPFLEILKIERPSLTIKLGGVLSNYKLHGPDTRKIFLRRANHEALNPKKKKLSKDFGHFVLSLNDELVATGPFFLQNSIFFNYSVLEIQKINCISKICFKIDLKKIHFRFFVSRLKTKTTGHVSLILVKFPHHKFAKSVFYRNFECYHNCKFYQNCKFSQNFKFNENLCFQKISRN